MYIRCEWKHPVNKRKGLKFKDYLVNSFGQVTNLKGEILKPRPNNRGYMMIDLYIDKKKYSMLLHRLVADTFIDNPDNLPTVNHLDGDKSINDVYNLEWASYSDNNLHAYANGLKESLKGEMSVFSKYDEMTIRRVCKRLEVESSPKRISRDMNLPLSLIRSIKSRESWTSVSKEYNMLETRFFMDKETENKIADMYHDGVDISGICLRIGWNTDSIYKKRVKRVIDKVERGVQRLS